MNINSIRNKFELLCKPVKDNMDVLIISETKTDGSCPRANFVKTVLALHIDLILMQMVVGIMLDAPLGGLYVELNLFNCLILVLF